MTFTRPPIILCVLAAATTLLLPLAVFAESAAFRASRDLLLEPLDTPHLIEAALDAHIFAETRPGFPDLRLFDDAGRDLPRAVEPLHTTQAHVRRQSVAAQVKELRELPDNRIAARFEIAPDAPAPAALDIRTPLRDFIRAVTVSGSDDGQQWHSLVEDAEIFDYSRYMDVRHTGIQLPSNSYRHFSIEIGNASEERAQPLIRLVQQDGRDSRRAFDLLTTPFRIDGISFWHTTTLMKPDQPVLQDWPHAGFTVTEDTKEKTSILILETGQAPISQLTLESPDRNFQRRATVMAPVAAPARAAGAPQWKTIGQGVFTRVDLPGYSREDLTIDFPEIRAAQLRLVLHNADNPPIQVSDVLPRGPTYRLLWLAEPGRNYRLAYGHERIAMPSHDLFAIRTALQQGLEPARAALAEPVQTETVRSAFHLGDFLARPAVFGTALVLAALALLVLLAKALRKT